MEDLRSFSPSFERNIAPITEKLKTVLPTTPATILEIGSGSGQHATHLAQSFPQHTFQPSETYSSALSSIDAWRKHFTSTNVMPATELDVTKSDWGFSNQHFSAILAFNVIHYAPWLVTEYLIANAGSYLKPNGKIIFYGPYKIDGGHTAPSNESFDEWLKTKSPEFGVRDIGEVMQVAERSGYRLEALHPMPANNFMPVFSRS